MPGVVLINKYDTHTTHENFSNYINYISRKDAVDSKDFHQYLEYMDNPEKQANLFTKDKDFLQKEEKENLKEIFSGVENRDGVMWETVISFDNKWLEENDLYHSDTGWTDEDELKRLTRGAVSRLEKQEGLQLTWAGAIHHNTDNIHIHIASVEKNPRKKEKEYQIVEFPEKWLSQHGILTKKNFSEIEHGVTKTTAKPVDGTTAYRDIMRDLKSSVQEETGRPFFCRNRIEITRNNAVRVSLSRNAGAIPDGAYVVGHYKDVDATFKEKSMDAAKSYIVHEVIRDDDALKKINHLIRDEIVNPSREQIPEFIKENEEMSREFLNLYHELSMTGTSRREWTYGTNKIASVRPDIDEFSEKLIDSYFPKEKAELNKTISDTASKYRRAFGDSEKADQYQTGRQKDLKKRMGNAVLHSLREYDRQIHGGSSRSDGEKSSNKTSEKKTPQKTKTSGGGGGGKPVAALENTLRQMEMEARRALAEASRAEQEQQYILEQEVSEDERLEKERIRQGEQEAREAMYR